MTIFNKLTPLVLIALFFCQTDIWAQENNNDTHKPEWGLEFITEQQLTHEKDYNCANYLHLSAHLPVSRKISFDLATISTYMTSSESIGDDLQVFSNLDAENRALALAVCGINWDINAQHSLFAGVRNMNEDYFNSPVTSFFTNSSCGIFPTLSSNYPVANYPLASVGIHYRYATEHLGFQASVYNGIGYNHFTGRHNVFRVCPQNDGVFALSQIDYNYKGSSYFLGLGFRQADSHTSVSPWIYAEQALTTNFSLMVAYSHAFMANAECHDFAGIGGLYSWKRCELGIFTNYARFAEAGECATELSCKVDVFPHIYIQPTAHFIVSPIGDSNNKTAFHSVATLRLGIEF